MIRLVAFRAALAGLIVAAVVAPCDAVRAAEPVRLRILTYNIHHGAGTDGRVDLERIARVIKSSEADIVALQEVDRLTARTGNVDQPAELGRLTGLHVAFGGNIRVAGGDYGNAVLSRLPIKRHENRRLPLFDDGEQRGVLEVEVELPGQQPLLLLATHLDHRAADRERLASAEVLSELAAAAGERPLLLAGDLNATPDSAVLRRLKRQWKMPDDASLLTSPAGHPRRQIDYILVHPQPRWRIDGVRVLPEAVASDHRPLLATMVLLPGAK